MIRIGRDGLDVVVDLEHGLPVGDVKHVRLKWGCQSEITAAALVAALQQHVEATVIEVRRLEYEAGWNDHRTRRRKDKARRKPKRTWFRGNLTKEAP